MNSITELQAYRAMLLFLDRHFKETGSDDIGALLGSASLLDGGGSVDPAMREEWMRSVARSLALDGGRKAAE